MPFYIKSVQTGLVLDVRNGEKRNGAEIIMWPYNGGDNQLWEYKNDMIVSKHSGFVLDIAGGLHANPIITFNKHGGANQKWYFDDDFTIRSATGNVMDVEGGFAAQGCRVIAFSKHGGPNQKFRVVPVNKKW